MSEVGGENKGGRDQSGGFKDSVSVIGGAG